MKQATHVQPIEGHRLNIHVCEWGGFIVTTTGREDYCMGTTAAFATADQAADWVRGFLRNRAHAMFGAKKPEKKS